MKDVDFLEFFILVLAFITPILLVLYDVFIPKTNYKILKNKVFLKLGILGMYAGDFLVTKENLLQKSMSQTQCAFILCSAICLLIYLIKNRIVQVSLYDVFCIIFVSYVLIFEFLAFHVEGFAFAVMSAIPPVFFSLIFYILFVFKVFKKFCTKKIKTKREEEL